MLPFILSLTQIYIYKCCLLAIIIFFNITVLSEEVRQSLPVLITSLSSLGVSSSLGWVVTKLRFDFMTYVKRFVSFLPQVCGFLRVLRFPPPIKLTVMKLPIWCTLGVESDVKPHQTNKKQSYLKGKQTSCFLI